MGFEPTTSCIRGKRLTARSRGPHGREQTTPRLILKHLESIFLHNLEIVKKFGFFSQLTLFYRVECEKLFCKTSIKLTCIKIN